jgi:meso-butanediol dehydrogenase/(S,S)-butanediol dehydrogenase/diacetyl reductase
LRGDEQVAPQTKRSVMAVNLSSVFYVAEQAAMVAGNGGVIINMGSKNGLTGYRYYADYNQPRQM